jgi:hypothetical protein
VSSCPSRRRELFELVDGALAVREQEKLHAHLVDCAACRSELSALRGVRERLRTPIGPETTPDALTSRLIGIAGANAAQPLYARPFDRDLGRPLPSRRRTRHALAGAVTVTCLLLAGLVGVGWAAAPPTRTPVVDPGLIARDEFAAVLGDAPLANPAVSALRATGLAEEKTVRLVGPSAPTGALNTDGAVAALERANHARTVTAYAGTQVVQVRHLAGYWVARVEVEVRPGQGAQVRFPSGRSSGRDVVVPQPPADLALFIHRHQLRTGPGPEIAGHRTVVVEALSDGRPRARWWLHADSGIVVWQQTFATDGSVVLNAGFRTLSVGSVDAPRHLPPMLTPSRGMTALTMSASALQRNGRQWWGHRRVAGLDLVTLRGGADPVVHSVYGDGVTTLSVLQQKGALTGAPDGFVWDPEIRAYRSLGITTMFTWQSGETVFTVATDGAAELAERAVADLPHDRPVLRTRGERVVDGWRRLAGVSR